MTDQIGLLGAFLGGLLTLVSPCAALLLPSFFAFTYTGSGSLITRVGLFFLGLIAVLAPVGAGVGAAGSLFIDHRQLLVTIGAIVIIVLGVVMILGRGFGLGKLSGLANGVDVTGPLSTIALGAVYGFAGFCSGPILGAVLTVGLVSGSPGYGALVMTAYAVGMTMPLLLLAALWPRIGDRVRSVLRGRELTWGRFTVHTTSLISGLVLIAIGIFVWVTEGTASVGSPVGSDTQFAWQSTIAEWTSGISDLEVVTAVVAVVFAVVAVRVYRRNRSAG